LYPILSELYPNRIHDHPEEGELFMLEPASGEITELATAYMSACLERRTDAVGEMAHPQFDGIGGPDERFTRDSLMEHLPGFPPARLVDSAPTGWVDGDVAWTVDFPHFGFQDGAERYHRVTTVLARVDGAWKVAHFHVSEPVGAYFETEAYLKGT
jgi:hypothetical protein